MNFVKRTSGGGGDLPPPPEPPAIEGQGLSVPAPPHDLKVKMYTVATFWWAEFRQDQLRMTRVFIIEKKNRFPHLRQAFRAVVRDPSAYLSAGWHGR